MEVFKRSTMCSAWGITLYRRVGGDATADAGLIDIVINKTRAHVKHARARQLKITNQ